MNVFFIGIIVVAVIFAVFYKQKNTTNNTTSVVTVDTLFNSIKSQLPTLSITQEAEVKSWLRAWLANGNTGTPDVALLKTQLGL
jgi:hypothetical protein